MKSVIDISSGFPTVQDALKDGEDLLGMGLSKRNAQQASKQASPAACRDLGQKGKRVLNKTRTALTKWRINYVKVQPAAVRQCKL